MKMMRMNGSLELCARMNFASNSSVFANYEVWNVLPVYDVHLICVLVCIMESRM